LIKEGSGVASNILHHLGIGLEKCRLEVESIVQRGSHRSLNKSPNHTPRTKQVLEFAIEEARGLGHNYVGTEHLLLGLLRVKEGIAAQVLKNLGVMLETVREEVLSILGMSVTTHEEASALPTWSVSRAKDDKLAEIKKIVDYATDPLSALQAIKELLG
jgi:ATP-dependent Clp protease ATP-binding subunit ClpA